MTEHQRAAAIAIVTAAKAVLRSDAKARRSAMPALIRQTASLRLGEHAATIRNQLGARDSVIVGGFMPIGEEISPLPLMQRLAEQGCRLALPVMMGKNAPLQFRAYSQGDALASVVWGIREPTADKQTVVPDVVLVALLAFDDSGYRLGYGGGYYDRTIAALRATGTPHTFGVAYDEQRVDAVPHLDYDEPIDWILTPARAHKIGT